MYAGFLLLLNNIVCTYKRRYGGNVCVADSSLWTLMLQFMQLFHLFRSSSIFDISNKLRIAIPALFVLVLAAASTGGFLQKLIPVETVVKVVGISISVRHGVSFTGWRIYAVAVEEGMRIISLSIRHGERERKRKEDKFLERGKLVRNIKIHAYAIKSQQKSVDDPTVYTSLPTTRF